MQGKIDDGSSDMNMIDHQEHRQPALMTVGEAARYLGVARKIIYQLIEYNQLQAIRDRGAVRIQKQCVDEIRRGGVIP